MNSSATQPPSIATTGIGVRRSHTDVRVPPAVRSLQPWVDAAVFGAAEVHGAEVLTRHAVTRDVSSAPVSDHDQRDHGDHGVHLAAALALWAPLHGHTCADLAHIAAQVGAAAAIASVEQLPGDSLSEQLDDLTASAPRIEALPWPTLSGWLDALHRQNIVRVVDHPDPVVVLDDRPLVLCGTSIYTQRQWADECSVASALRSLAGGVAKPSPSVDAAQLLDRLLPRVDDDAPNLQHIAARNVLDRNLTVIVGGPGTGKTHTIARTLAVLLTDADASQRSARIGLAAPTGKAATRMGEAVAAAAAEGRATGVLSEHLAARLANVNASTIHRLLGSRRASTRFRHDAQNPLPYDVIVIDEASMVALPLMARLLDAVRPGTRLVLVGDPDQLFSIQVGAVLADIVTAGEVAGAPLHGCVVRLRRQRRQVDDSPVSRLADSVREGQPEAVLELLRHALPDAADRSTTLLTFVETDDPTIAAERVDVRAVIEGPLTAAQRSARAGDAATALRLFSTIRVLCAHRTGPHGVDRWNRIIERWLLDATSTAGHPALHSPRLAPGRALLATRNDPRQHVANGDTGIVVNTPSGVRAAFGTADDVRLLAPAQLEGVETAYATTVHKSQGSEYDAVVVVLPPVGSPLVGREMLYTAITRSTHRVVLIGSAAAVIACVETPSRRISGLAAALTVAP